MASGDAPQTAIPDFLKTVERPGAVVEKQEGARTVCWFEGTDEIDLHGLFTADELRRMADMVDGISSRMTDAEIVERRQADPALIACCPERKTLPASQAASREWSETSYVVAVWWRDDGYGGTYRAENRRDAEAEATRMVEQGYGDGSRGGGDEVRIVEVRKTWTAWSKPNAR